VLSLATLLGIAIAPRLARAQSLADTRVQAATPTNSIRLGDLYDEVRRANPAIAAAQAFARAAQARVAGASRPPDPQLQLGFMNYALPSLAPMETLGMTQLQLMQVVPVGGKLTLGRQVAGAQASAADRRAQDSWWEARTRAAMAFYDLYATDRQLEVARETYRLLQDIARTAEAMYRVGSGRQADVLRANVEIARMAEDTVRMQAMRRSMIARLDALRDRDDVSASYLPVLPRFPDRMPAEASLDSISANNRSMIQAGVDDLRAAGAAARLARREIIPDLQVGVQYAQRRSTMESSATERMASVMIGASIPIFARSRQLKMRDEADAMSQMARAELAAMRADTRGKIGEAYAGLNRARDLARLYRTTVLPQAEATASSALSAYRAGSVDFMTLLDNQMTVNRYRQDLYVLEADEGKAWAELEMLTGRQLIDASSVGNNHESGGTLRPGGIQ